MDTMPKIRAAVLSAMTERLGNLADHFTSEELEIAVAFHARQVVARNLDVNTLEYEAENDWMYDASSH